MSDRYNPRAGIAVGQIPSDCYAPAWPPIISTDELIGRSSFGVSSCWVIMMGMQDFWIQGFIVRDIKQAIYIQQTILHDTLTKRNRAGVMNGSECRVARLGNTKAGTRVLVYKQSSIVTNTKGKKQKRNRKTKQKTCAGRQQVNRLLRKERRKQN